GGFSTNVVTGDRMNGHWVDKQLPRSLGIEPMERARRQTPRVVEPALGVDGDNTSGVCGAVLSSRRTLLRAALIPWRSRDCPGGLLAKCSPLNIPIEGSDASLTLSW